MNKKHLFIPAVIAAIAIGTLGYVGSQEAEAHQRITGLNFGTIIIGHDNEPSFGHEKGVWLGKHATEVFLRDGDGNPITGQGFDAETGDGLLVDKYYFKNVKKYNKANSVSQATATSLDNPLIEVFGEPGTYHSDQIIQSGIYGYKVHGTINGESINVTLFCATGGMDEPDKFEETDGGTPEREFTCPRDIDDIKFPSDKKSKHDDD